jgi:hypothetical protein
VRSSLFQTSPPFVVNLGRGHVPVAEQLLHLDDVHPGIEEQRRRGRTQRVRRVDAPLDLPHSPILIRDLFFPHGRGEPRQVALNQVVHRDGADGRASGLLTARVQPGAKERPFGQLRLGDVGGNCLGCGEMEPDAAVLVALLVKRDGRLVAVLMEVLDPEATRRSNSGAACSPKATSRS